MTTAPRDELDGWPVAGAAADARPHQGGVVVLGEALVDVFPDRAVIGGAPFNVARNLAGFGAQPALTTRIGRDGNGTLVLAECARFGIDPRGVQVDARAPTGSVTVHLHEGEHRFEIAAHQAWDMLDARAALDTVAACKPSLIYFGTLAQRSPLSRNAIRAALHSTGATRFLDLNLREQQGEQAIAAESLALAHIVKVNESELAQVLRWFVRAIGTDHDFGSALHRSDVALLMERFDLHTLIVTRGKDGATAFSRHSGSMVNCVAPNTDVHDTVGAGDGFAAAMLFGHLRGWPIQEALARATRFGSWVCQMRGAVNTDLTVYATWAKVWQQDEQHGRG